MTDTPKQIGLVSNGLGGWRLWSTDEPDTGGCDYPDAEYILAAEHERIMAEARNMALEEVALYIEQRDGSIPCRQEIASAIRAMKD